MSERNRPRDPEKRQAIIQAAKSAFTEHGVQNTSMDALASLANVSKRTVYNHFESKDQLVSELLSGLWEQSKLQPHIALSTGAPLKERLITLVLAEVEVLCNEEFMELVRIGFGYFLYQPGAFKRLVDSLRTEDTALYKLLDESIKAKELRPFTVEYTFEQLDILIRGRCFWPQLCQVEPVLDVAQRKWLAQDVVEIFLSHFAT